jgi:hypothetical protein
VTVCERECSQANDGQPGEEWRMRLGVHDVPLAHILPWLSAGAGSSRPINQHHAHRAHGLMAGVVAGS